MEHAMVDTNGGELLYRLTEEIERAWNERRDYEIVHRLADEHPELATELYEFFADVFEADDQVDRQRPERAEMDASVVAWLREEGYALGAASFDAPGREATTTPFSLSEGCSDSTTNSPAVPGESFVGYLRRTTDESVERLAADIDITQEFLIGLSDNGAIVPPRARSEVCRRVMRVHRLDEKTLLSVLAQSGQTPMAKAASRQRAYASKKLTYADIVRWSNMDDIRQRFWLELD